jgi:hypothetical protein
MKQLINGLCSASAALALIVLALSAGVAFSSVNERVYDAVTLTGADVEDLQGVAPGLIVAFRFDASWQQIPMQIDEVDTVDFGTIYSIEPMGFSTLVYTDTSTFTGPDADPTFDVNDELVFMAEDAGAKCMAGTVPPGVEPMSGMELAIVDPLDGDTAYAYLFESLGTLDPSAGADTIDYSFNLISGAYKTTYGIETGPNPESSYVVTPAYSVHFADRWIRDEIRVTEEGASGLDILDRHRNLFAPGNCTRSEDTFSAGEGAFIVNRRGPIRALRGYIGANSGPRTSRVHAFYRKREDVVTHLRVHSIPGVVDFMDYSPDAAGMTYYNDLNTGGVSVDGVPDTVTPGEMTWEMVTGPQGTLVTAVSVTTDIPDFDYTSYYSDDSTPPLTQCTGDDYEYGASGFREDETIPNTEPNVEPFSIFEAYRTIIYGPPGQDTSYAEQCADWILNPLALSAAPYAPTAGVEGRDGTQATRPAIMSFSLGPNPSLGSVHLVFTLGRAAAFSVSIYDVGGREVSELIVRVHAAGRHQLDWDVSGLPSGLYFVRASMPSGDVAVRRLVVLR